MEETSPDPEGLKDNYLLDVISELQRRIDARPVGCDTAPAAFHNKTLAELTRRIEQEDKLKVDLKCALIKIKELQNRCISVENDADPLTEQATRNLKQENTRLKCERVRDKAELKRSIHDLAVLEGKYKESIRARATLAKKYDEIVHDHQILRGKFNDLAKERDELDLKYEDERTKRLRHLQKLETPNAEQQTKIIRPSIENQNSTKEMKLFRRKVAALEEKRKRKNDDNTRLSNKNKPTNGHLSSDDDSDYGVSLGDAQDETGRGLPIGLRRLPSCSLPDFRLNCFKKNRTQDDLLINRNEIVIFNRRFLNKHLGGKLIAWHVLISPEKRKHLAIKLGIKTYLCPNLAVNAWAPSYPGENGHLFVGLGNETDIFKKEETHELFIQYDPKQMFYAGRYRCLKADGLSVKEWKTLSQKAQINYSKATRKKARLDAEIDVIRDMYDGGLMEVPCVRVDFVDYNWDLYRALESEATKEKEVSLIVPKTRELKRKYSDEEHRGPEGPRKYHTKEKQGKVESKIIQDVNETNRPLNPNSRYK